MKLKHDELKEKLPDYITGSVAGDETLVIESHVQECEECSEELELLRALLAGGAVPEPEAFFFDSLPDKTVSAMREKRRMGLFARLVPALAALGLVVLAVFLYRDSGTWRQVDDPLALEAVEYSLISYEDVPKIAVSPGEIEVIADETGYFAGDDYDEYLFFLEDEELDSLNESLDSAIDEHRRLGKSGKTSININLRRFT
jgi:hypothetical protein